MKALNASLLAAVVAAASLASASADAGKTLQNVKGSVGYGTSAANPNHSLAPKASTALNDADYAFTGASSMAMIGLPDSSQIEMASNTSVQLVSFNQTDIAHAKFVVVGKMRFSVNHPSGAHADYTFQTTTGQIAVRGTIGDIVANPNGMEVVVYQASEPVVVTLTNGQVFTLEPGQALVVTNVAGTLSASVTSITQEIAQSVSELNPGVATNGLGIYSVKPAIAAGTGAGSTAAIAGGALLAGGAAAAISNANSAASPSPAPIVVPTASPTASPTPSPQPSTTSVPITVNHAGPNPHRTPGANP
jgi:hypothetical protein